MFLTRMVAVSATTLLAGIIPPTAATKPPAPKETCEIGSKYNGEQYSPRQLARLAKDTGFSGDGLVLAVAVALAESSGWSKAVLVNENCTIDRGLWQINSYWHPEVSETQAFDPKKNAQAALEISSEGTDWTQWSTFVGNDYKQHLDEARQAIAELSAS